MKIITILGARPQFIKASSISREILYRNNISKNINEIIIHTGQHYDANLSDIFFNELKIPKPKYSLGIGGISHGAMTGRMIEKIERILSKERPKWVIVYGDTNSTLAGAIAASKLNIKIAHVESGLRSFNMSMPEEINRILTDRISSVLFCPTTNAVINLEKEGVNEWGNNVKVILSGDVMLDNAIFYKNFATKPKNMQFSDDFILCTIHRQENTDDPIKLTQIILAINEIAKEKKVIFPMHPRTKKIIKSMNLEIRNIEPVGYLNMLWLINKCSLVITDSGGLQKEAYFFNKPCIIIRDETEWTELSENEAYVLVDANKDKIINTYAILSKIIMKKNILSLFGKSTASQIIVKELLL
jgi:UDP-GlcNAc3NAcA epimerase